MQTLDKSLDEVCEALDNLSIQNLELIEEKVLLSIQLENLLRQGHIDLAKARYIRGKESVGMLQVPSEDNEIRSLFDLETSYSKDEPEKMKDIPNFDISLRKSNKEEEAPQDPIKWFGVLVPQSLKSAQKHFQDALYLTVKIANIQAQLTEVTSQSASLKLLKKITT